jgi:hypothetical protein
MAPCNNGDGSTSFERMILTEFLFLEVQEYLDYPNININNILNVSRKFHDIKKLYCYWKLNKQYSIEYYSNDIYRAKMVLLLSNTRTQLSLDLSDPHHHSLISDVSVLGSVHAL